MTTIHTKPNGANRNSTQLELYRSISGSAGAPEIAGDLGEKRKMQVEIEPHNLGSDLQPYVTKKHDATRLHYDFRLGWNGVLISFALPEGPSFYPGDKREAIGVEDHSRENAGFEGVIPEGRYGAGTVMLWDCGMWKPSRGYSDVDACLRNGVLKFTLYAEKLKGDWTLTRIRGDRRRGSGTVWVLNKELDAFARGKEALSILEEMPNSVSTGRTLEEIRQDWYGGNSANESGQLTLF
jgi:bifunctional non-homologous end joining protein LigD